LKELHSDVLWNLQQSGKLWVGEQMRNQFRATENATTVTLLRLPLCEHWLSLHRLVLWRRLLSPWRRWLGLWLQYRLNLRLWLWLRLRVLSRFWLGAFSWSDSVGPTVGFQLVGVLRLC
jgi:hypothetical protein